MKITREEFITIIKNNASEFDGRAISSTDQLATLGLDSLGFATTLFAIEDQLNISIDEAYLARLNSLSTVGDLVRVFADLGYEIEV
ncbi:MULTISPECIES: phosphopantetheine-binding protein [unclassified Undibacterium]|uniref:phosphopantetheine-binding protein n=1 Tax=unclassified Undibacterium TaxID=2630295 RepID=UPI002AC9BFB5|nr:MULTISPECIES: phosphopantetheine-binding protein [unclassified Undibacterium]MEB0140418.1 phosphopantetheine-binding protein [Undibacterium sp. CCC2.1]MEB0171692.1 phosphopantetheine-binding protein [Undibacterium sp. CCC1.1]MEB0177413.1 phosphopantetheine-binding protein [Undibacterium sp. CCC3.4]MEB0215038.1 phosphopantetheine-binding protein [Undibacterium sp. 5I2]WPX45115.1 phosphopantetheine-binding protein [Undibacterium sp. CCC3.4]